MANPRWARAALALLASVGLAPGEAAQPSAAGAIRSLQTWLDGTRDLTCRFEQSLESGALGSGGTESGTMRLLRPGRARWDYDEPEPKTAILDGVNTRVYLPGDRQMIQGTVPADGGAFHALLTGGGRLDEMFVASLVEPGDREGKGFRLRLVPRRQGETFEAVLLDLDPT